MYNSYRQQCPPGTFPYTIMAGDTFYRLAISFNTTVEALISANPRANPNYLLIGQIICIPRQLIYPTCPEGNYYIIRSGDTLYGIARRYNIDLYDLLGSNPGINAYMLKIGQVICIPLANIQVECPPNTMAYFIKSGDTFVKLANRFNTTISALIRFNPNINPESLLIGQKVCIPSFAEELPQTKKIPVYVEGEIEYRDASLESSDQGYTIYVLENYQFSGEEPGSDVLLSTMNDSLFVRIQRLPLYSNINDLRQNAILSLKDIGEPRELRGIEISDPYFRTNMFFINASNDLDSVNIILKEIDGALFRFTMFLSNVGTMKEPISSFYAMMKTIRLI